MKKNHNFTHRPIMRQTKNAPKIAKTVKPNKREEDFKEAFERFLAEYRMDRIADIHDFLEKDIEYKKLIENKIQREEALNASIKSLDILGIFLDYATSVDSLLEEVQAIFYEHGFQDSITISKAIHENLNSKFLRTLIELDKE